MVALLGERATEILELLRQLCRKSAVEQTKNDPTSSIVVVGPNRWADLDSDGVQLQSRLLNELERYTPLVEALVRVAPERVRSDVREANDAVRQVVDQSGGTWYFSSEDAFKDAELGLTKQLDHLRSLYDSGGGEPIFVPDTNAMIFNPDLDEWAFPDVPRFELVLTSTILGELDKLKVTYSVEDVRKTSESVIKRIKEYRRRGDIHKGVPLRKGRSTIRMVAVEPDFRQTLPWFDPAVEDDRFLATTIEIIRQHPHSPVAIVTGDINLQNKAAHAGIPFVEPPAPPRGRPQRASTVTDRGDVRIVELKATGGGRHVDFDVYVQNYGTGPTRATVSASVGERPVEVAPPVLDLLPNTEPSRVAISLPRPELGELMKECNNETTLYGEELRLEVAAGGKQKTETWRENVYDEAKDRARHEVQQRYWRYGRGEATEQDHHAERMAGMQERALERMKNRDDLKET